MARIVMRSTDHRTASPDRTQPGARRRRRGIAARRAAVFGFACFALLSAAGPAWAAGKTIGGCMLEKMEAAEEEYGSGVEEFDEKEQKSLEKKLEGCIEAPNPIFPELNEVIWGGAAFLVLFAFMQWKGFPAVKRAMDARSQRISDDLDAADSAKADAQRTRSEYEAKLAEAETEAAEIVDEARAEAERLGRELRARAEEEAAEQRARAAAEIESSRSQAIDDLRSEVASIAVNAAERVVGASLDAKAHSALINGYIDEVADSAGGARAGGS